MSGVPSKFKLVIPPQRPIKPNVIHRAPDRSQTLHELSPMQKHTEFVKLTNSVMMTDDLNSCIVL